jgi:hypothetical protein
MWDEIDPLRDDRSAEARFQILDTYLRNHRGRGEIAELPSFDQPGKQLDRALARLAFVKEVLSALP